MIDPDLIHRLAGAEQLAAIDNDPFADFESVGDLNRSGFVATDRHRLQPRRLCLGINDPDSRL